MGERGWAEVDVRNGRWRVVKNGDGGKTDVNPTIDSQAQKRKEAQGGRPYTPRQGGLSVQVLDPTSAIPPIGSW